jgi:biopolymer transport protein ExbD
MAKRHHYRRRSAQPSELDMTTFLNLMVVLVPFLLITAVFSRITIVELTLPTSASAAAATEPSFRIEVIVREVGLEISNGKSVIAAIPKVNDEYDLATLSEMVMALKQENPDSNDASVLLEPNIEYDHLIQVMDVVRSAALPPSAADEDAIATDDADDAAGGDGGAPQIMRVALFTDISIGDAP